MLCCAFDVVRIRLTDCEIICNSKMSLNFQLPGIPALGLLATFCAVASCASNGGNGVCA